MISNPKCREKSQRKSANWSKRTTLSIRKWAILKLRYSKSPKKLANLMYRFLDCLLNWRLSMRITKILRLSSKGCNRRKKNCFSNSLKSRALARHLNQSSTLWVTQWMLRSPIKRNWISSTKTWELKSNSSRQNSRTLRNRDLVSKKTLRNSTNE